MFQNLYSIDNESLLEGIFSYGISFNTDHQIFKVHFPGTPITPGACQVEIIRQLVASYLRKDVQIIEVKNIKFLKIISPQDNPSVLVEGQLSREQETNRIKCTALIRNTDSIFTKAVMILQTSIQ